MQHIQLIHSHTQGEETILDIAGTPQSYCLQGLQSATSYRLQAVLFNDGIQLAQSNIASFVTLGASAITLTLHNISRENYNYRVHYLFSSTYTLSSAVLSCNGQTFQGTINGNTITFIVTGLTAGDAYLYNVTATDVYGFQETVTGSITTTVINQVNIYYASRTENSVTFDLVYLHDYTFVSGWIDVWNSSQDPSTDQSISYDMWADGDSSVTATGLNYETTYKFRAAMTVVDAFGTQTTVYSSVLTQTTADHDFSNDYFTIKNEYAGSNPLKLVGDGISIDYSTDNGSTWTTVALTGQTGGTTATTMDSGDEVLLRHVGDMPHRGLTVRCDSIFSVKGNTASLVYGDNFAGRSLSNSSLSYLFYNARTLTDASNLVIYNTVKSMEGMFYNCDRLLTVPNLEKFTSAGASSMNGMFYNCAALVTSPNLSNIESVGASGMQNMFHGCSSLATPPNLSKVKSVGYGGMYGMFSNCTSLTTTPNFTNVTSAGENAFYFCFDNCTALTRAYAPTITDWTSNACPTSYWLYGVAANGTLYANSSIASMIPINDWSGCPSGWTVQTI